MTISTTARNACDIGIRLDNASGTLTDISGSSNAVTLTLSQNVGESRVFGSRWPAREVCGKDAKVALTVLYTTASDEGYDILANWFNETDPQPRTLYLYFPNKNVGSDVYYGEFVLESYETPATAGEAAPIMVSASLLIDGAITYTVAAT